VGVTALFPLMSMFLAARRQQKRSCMGSYSYKRKSGAPAQLPGNE
jgi:hypothetical protein